MLSIESSVAAILSCQSPNGAIVAAPDYPTYAYCWLRDGSFAAYSLIAAGRRDRALDFLLWCSRTLVSLKPVIDSLEKKLAAGARTSPSDFPPTRFRLDGSVAGDDWPNHQIDGYGAWLWCLAEWHRATGAERLDDRFRPAAELTLRYLSLAWRMPCSDCWEENEDKIHLSTLACVYGGLRALGGLAPELGAAPIAAEVKAFADASILPIGRYPKYLGTTAVDASLLWLALPFGLASADDPAFRSTVERIEATLLRDGGVARYAEDSYYGGGQWVILSAWLGWLYAETGRVAEAEAMLAWVESAADPAGLLPEQVPTRLNDPAYLPVWEGRWGASARPLAWSHAMHLALARAIEGARGSDSAKVPAAGRDAIDTSSSRRPR
jgi:GH15 family glucan-1,4-alpha-glucosidase